MKKAKGAEARYQALKKSCVSFLDEMYRETRKIVVFGEGLSWF